MTFLLDSAESVWYFSRVTDSGKYKYLIENFLFDHKKCNFFHQRKQAKKLVSFFPDIEFWKWLKNNYKDYQVYTLVSYLKPDKLAFLRKQLKVMDFKFKEKRTYVLSDEKFGKDKEMRPRRFSTLDFLRYGKKEEG